MINKINIFANKEERESFKKDLKKITKAIAIFIKHDVKIKISLLPEELTQLCNLKPDELKKLHNNAIKTISSHDLICKLITNKAIGKFLKDNSRLVFKDSEVFLDCDYINKRSLTNFNKNINTILIKDFKKITQKAIDYKKKKYAIEKIKDPRFNNKYRTRN